VPQELLQLLQSARAFDANSEEFGLARTVIAGPYFELLRLSVALEVGSTGRRVPPSFAIRRNRQGLGDL
jgi:hypothetical protein